MLKEQLNQVETLGPVGIKLRTQMEMLFDKLANKNEGNRKADIISLINNNKIDFNIAIQLSHSMIATGVSEGQNLTQLAMAIGDRVLAFYKINKKASISLKLGVFIINSYSTLFMVVVKLINEYYQHNRVKTVYKVYAGKNRNDLRKLVKEFSEESDPYKPLLTKAPNWEFGKVTIDNGEQINLIKNVNNDVLSQININNTPIVLNAVNKKQAIGYYVKPELFDVYKWALKTGQDCFEHNSVKTISKERSAAKKREAEQILHAAKPFVGKVFYQQYQADNRGRLYPLSAYLNELNSDNAKGMLSFAIGKPLGNNGLGELYHHIANMFGEDKLPHNDKVKFVEKEYYNFVKMGKDPYNSKGWMKQKNHSNFYPQLWS